MSRVWGSSPGKRARGNKHASDDLDSGFIVVSDWLNNTTHKNQNTHTQVSCVYTLTLESFLFALNDLIMEGYLGERAMEAIARAAAT
jgi:hypothetical protein